MQSTGITIGLSTSHATIAIVGGIHIMLAVQQLLGGQKRAPHDQVHEGERRDRVVLVRVALHRHLHHQKLDRRAVGVVRQELLARPRAEHRA
eukprot:3799346-Prymnesium_polylepis.1